MAKNKIKVGLSDIKASVKDVSKSVDALSDKAESFFDFVTESMQDFVKVNKNTTDSVSDLYDDMFDGIEKRGKQASHSVESYFANLKKHGLDMNNLFTMRRRKQSAVNTALYGVATGKMTATPKEVGRIAGQKETLDKALSPSVFEPMVKGLRNTFVQSTLGRAGFGNLSSSLTSGYDRYKARQNELLESYSDTQAGYSERRDELMNESLKIKDLVAQKKMAPEVALGEQDRIAKELVSVSAKSEAAKLAMAKASTAETALFVKGTTGNVLADLAILAAQILISLFKDAKKMIDDVSTYSLSTSYKVNSQARQQALQYGLSDAQNYAFSQTKSIMGITSDEDMYYMNANQRAMFSNLMSKQEDFYNRLNSNGTLEGLQKMQIDFALMRQEFVATVGEFIVDNKDTIITFVTVGLDALKVIATILNGIFKGVSYLNPLNWFKSSGSSNVVTVNTTNRFYGSDGKSASEISNAISDKERIALSNFFNS